MHDGHRERTKKEFLARPDSFPDHKLLEVLLFYANPRGDTNPTAHALMDRFGSLSGVLDALPEELVKVPGVGEHTVVLLKTAKEMGGRYLLSRTDIQEVVRNSAGLFKVLRPYFYGARSERVCVLCLDGKMRCLGVRTLGEGDVNTARINARSIAEAALSLNAARVVLAHNHPSGVALPSEDDKATTQYLAQALSAIGVALWDHVILSDDDMVSMRDSGYPYFKA